MTTPPPTLPPSGSATRRRRGTRRRVRVMERLARVFITIGGLGTVVAVTTIFAFLLVVVLPLFRGADVGAPRRLAAAAPEARVVAMGSDDYGLIAWTLTADGVLGQVALGDGTTLGRRALVDGEPPTAVALMPDGSAGALGFADGRVRLLRLSFDTRTLVGSDVPAALEDLALGAPRPFEGGVAERLAGGDVRVQRVEGRLGETLQLTGGAVVRLDRSDVGGTVVLALVDATGQASVHRLVTKENPFDPGAPPQVSRQSADLPPSPSGPPGVALPSACLLSAAGDSVLLVWEDGRALRYDCRDLEAPRLAETLDLVEPPQARILALAWLLGKTTLVVGDSGGGVRCWFRTQPTAEPPGTADQALLSAAHVLSVDGAPVTALAPGHRTRLLFVGRADGSASLVSVTSEKPMCALGDAREPVLALAVAPKGDALLVRTARDLWHRTLDQGHPEASVKSLFRKVWYEGLEKPEYVWQSTGGTDDFEPKLSLIPLIFGTLKATLYSMLFGVPLALLAAVFTSEFLNPRLRASVKSVIEMMASLPSVVLGFVAAVVIAPFVQDVVPALLTAMVLLPTLLLAGAHLWQLLPQPLALRWGGAPRIAAMVAVFPLGILLSGALAPALEDGLFRGDLIGWLDHAVPAEELAEAGWRPPAEVGEAERPGLVVRAAEEAAGKRPAPGAARLLTPGQAEAVRASHLTHASGGWAFLLLPLVGIAVVFAVGRWVNPWVRARSTTWDRRTCGVVALVKFCGSALVAVLGALLLGRALVELGLDPRGDFALASRGEGAVMGSYVQRNALIVGFVMGFAIIPIIYTLAEDALSGVPQHLRLASLGAGATPWQTAVRVIIPTAMSGLFSAVMIGLGRAVGETMIVLMATGNTSVLDWNVFNGFRTLSANTATEMPEAVQGSTHYRVLFLGAFVLFAITFVLNTVAEAVRQRFRKRAFQL